MILYQNNLIFPLRFSKAYIFRFEDRKERNLHAHNMCWCVCVCVRGRRGEGGCGLGCCCVRERRKEPHEKERHTHKEERHTKTCSMWMQKRSRIEVGRKFTPQISGNDSQSHGFNKMGGFETLSKNRSSDCEEDLWKGLLVLERS